MCCVIFYEKWYVRQSSLLYYVHLTHCFILLFQWRGGKRDKYKPKKNKCIHTETGGNSAAAVPAPSFPKIDANTIDQGHWNCTHCQNKVSLTKSRCGKCHRWRGGKRKGGWKIKVSDVDESGIEWDKDWTCCEVMISAAKKRCGKCNGWRGGKRVAAKKQKHEVVDEDRHDTQVQEEVIVAKQQITI